MDGSLNSFLSMSTLDGEGVRCVAFLQGCPLRCVYCHNPEMQICSGGEPVTPLALLERTVRYKSYFGERGGITLSGGEPYLQSEFVAEFFELCKQKSINTAVETSGAVLDGYTVKSFSNTDLCMLDIKLTDEDDYQKYTNGSLSATLRFLDALEFAGVRTRVRQVIISGINDKREQVLQLKEICLHYKCVEKIILLPFRKLCIDKYKAMGRIFPLADTPETSMETISSLERFLL